MDAKTGLLILLLLTSFFSLGASAQPSLHEQAQLLGHPLAIHQESSADSSASGEHQQITQEVKTELLGHTTQLMKMDVHAAPSPGDGGAASGITLDQHDLYIGGVRVWNGRLSYDKTSLIYTGGVAPTQVPIPLVAYPLGPVLLQIDAGFEFEGEVEARLTVGPSYPLTDSVVMGKLSAQLYAAAYIDAYARLLFARAGVGGRVDVVDADAGFQSLFYLNGMKPTTSSYGYARFLSGKVYGFVDLKLLFGKWTRVIHHNFFQWKGKCLSFVEGAPSC